MFVSFVFALCASAQAPQLDGLATQNGIRLGVDDPQTLPHARHTADVLRSLTLEVNANELGGAGIDLFDAPRLSVHGWSTTQMRFAWGGLDITDVARPGQALIDLPIGAWRTLTLATLWTTQPGMQWQLPLSEGQEDAQPTRFSVQGGYAYGDVGGPALWPNAWFDRADARAFGAPDARRALTSGKEGTVIFSAPIYRGGVFALGERVEHAHRYLTTPNPEGLVRDTALLGLTRRVGDQQIQVRAATQLRHRDQEGAQYRFGPEEVQNTQSKAWLGQIETQGPLAPLVYLEAGLSVGSGHEQAQSRLPPAYAQDLIDPWLQLARVPYAQDLTRWQARSRVRLTLGATAHSAEQQPFFDAGADRTDSSGTLALTVEGALGGYRHTLVGGPERWGERYQGEGISMRVHEGDRTGSVALHQVRATLEQAFLLGRPGRSLNLTGGLDLSGINDPSGRLTQDVGPSAGALLRWPTRTLDAFVMVRREPEALTAQVGDFLGGQGVQGSVYSWQDKNADGLPDADEQGMRLGGFGADVHEVDAALKRPGHTQVALGFNTRPRWGVQLGLRTVGHVLSGRYDVVATNPGAAQPAAFHDPGGDGRGEVRAAGGGQDLTVYAEPRVSDGYRLRNDPTLAAYGGLEAEVHTAPHEKFYVHAMGAAYLSRGRAPFGAFADRNDPGIVDEASATRNQRLHSLGRLDADRSYTLKILAGVKPVRGLSVGLAARYSDGQPFVRMVAAPDLPQGPVALMATPRGKVRHTATMSWDVRLRYETLALKPLGITFVCDLYNLFNARTEIAEDPRTGASFRRALEMVPGRAVWAGLTLAFVP